MKYVVIVDSMSNIPEHVLKARTNIKQIPFNIQIGSELKRDIFEAEKLNQFYSDNILKTETNVDATSPTPDQMSVFMVNEVAPFYDYAIFQSTSAVLSEAFSSIKSCAQMIENDARTVRKMANILTPFKLIISNSGNSSSGQTLLALYTDALISKGTTPEAAVEKADQIKKVIKTYSVISNLLQARSRMKMTGHKTISMSSAVSGQLKRNAPLVSLCNDEFDINHLKIGYKQSIKKLFEYAENCIDSGLYLPIINVSYAGKIRDLHAMQEFKSLQNKAIEHGVKVISGMMSISACINYSAGSISLGIAPKDMSTEP